MAKLKGKPLPAGKPDSSEKFNKHVSAGGPATFEDLTDLSGVEAASAVIEGIPASIAQEFATKLGLTASEMAELLRSTERTYSRRITEGWLDQAEAERIWELVRLFERAVDVLGSEESAARWFKSPLPVLRYQTPIQYARTTPGIRELERILGRIEHGVFS